MLQFRCFFIPLTALVFPFLFAACAPSKEEIEKFNDEFTLVEKEVIEIPIDSNASNFSYYPLYFSDGVREYYVTGNENLNTIDFYDLEKRALSKRITFERTGLDAVSSTRIIFIKSLDSIYIQDGKQIWLTDTTGTIKKKYAVPPNYITMTNLYQPFTVINQHAYLGYMNRGDNRAQVGYQIKVKLDLISGEIEWFGPKYPIVFNKYLYYGFIPATAFGPNNNLAARFGSLPEIYNYDSKTDSTFVHLARSRFQEADIRPDTSAYELSEMNKYYELLEQGNYGGLLYDRFNHLYYSLFQPPIPQKDSAGNFHMYEDKPVTVMLLNEEFKIVGEAPLKRNVYGNNYIPTSRGLMIPMSHPKNKMNDPRKIRFQIFGVKKLQADQVKAN
jgi:hypothetical protein